MHPLVYGDYPNSIKKNAGSRLPAFTGLQSKQVKGSFDFIGLNFYFTMYVKDQPSSLGMEERDVTADMELELLRMSPHITNQGVCSQKACLGRIVSCAVTPFRM